MQLLIKVLIEVITCFPLIYFENKGNIENEKVRSVASIKDVASNTGFTVAQNNGHL